MGKITDLDAIQRIVVLALLRDDHDDLWTFDELHEEIQNAPPDALRQAIKKLEAGKAVETTEGTHLIAWATDGLRHIDALGMVMI